MKKCTITAKPVFELDINLELVKLLVRCALYHYDLKCQNAGRCGGFLYGWQNMLEIGDGGLLPQASFHELDTSLKICEVGMYLLTPEDYGLICKYVKYVHAILKFANQVVPTWQATFNFERG